MSSSMDGKSKPFWQKPFLWVGAILVAALGTALTNAIQPLFDRGITAVTEVGDPVSVRMEVRNADEDVLLPSTVEVTEDDLQVLNGMARLSEQVDWLEARGGIVAGPRTLLVTLRGERSNPVRITDIRDASDCAPPDRGTLFRMVYGRGATSDSIRIGIYVGEPSKDAWLWDSEAQEAKPFFPDRTITLQKAEEEIVLVDLYPQQGQVCRVQLEMTVVEGDRTLIQKIDPESFHVIQVEPEEVETAYDHVYLSGGICNVAVEATRNWTSDIEGVCGPGNSFGRRF